MPSSPPSSSQEEFAPVSSLRSRFEQLQASSTAPSPNASKPRTPSTGSSTAPPPRPTSTKPVLLGSGANGSRAELGSGILKPSSLQAGREKTSVRSTSEGLLSIGISTKPVPVDARSVSSEATEVPKARVSSSPVVSPSYFTIALPDVPSSTSTQSPVSSRPTPTAPKPRPALASFPSSSPNPFLPATNRHKDSPPQINAPSERSRPPSPPSTSINFRSTSAASLKAPPPPPSRSSKPSRDPSTSSTAASKPTPSAAEGPQSEDPAAAPISIADLRSRFNSQSSSSVSSPVITPCSTSSKPQPSRFPFPTATSPTSRSPQLPDASILPPPIPSHRPPTLISHNTSTGGLKAPPPPPPPRKQSMTAPPTPAPSSPSIPPASMPLLAPPATSPPARTLSEPPPALIDPSDQQLSLPIPPPIPARAVTIQPGETVPSVTPASAFLKPKLPARQGSISASSASPSTSRSRSSTIGSEPAIEEPESLEESPELPPRPPPIPNNRPVLAPPLAPPLAERPRPNLPQRSNSHAVSSAPPPRHVAAQSTSSLLPPPPPPLPGRLAAPSPSAFPSSGAGANLQRSATARPITRKQTLARRLEEKAADDGYQPPPPPMRKIAPNEPPPPLSPRKSVSRDQGEEDEDEEGGGRDSDEDEEDTDPSTSIPHAVPKKSDDFPDPTLSNRRLPILRPDPIRLVGVSGHHHVTSFACSGDFVAVGSHHLRVYDISHGGDGKLSDLVLDQKEIGLDVKAKDPRVTALCFRPSLEPGEENRFLWGGTKDGHLWEIDLWTTKVVQTRTLAHQGAVTNIFRYSSSVLTLDESGKAFVYSPNESNAYNINSPALTLRIADRQTHIALLGRYLWACSAGSHASSSTTTRGSRAPTIRVYDPFGPAAASSSGVRVLIVPDTISGAVTASAIIPSRPSEVYLGHEGGQISIWDRETFTCIKVLKIATSAVVCLIGVGSRLWAGSRSGKIHVYSVETTPWTVTSLWMAHDSQPVVGFEVDVDSLAKGTLKVYSWGRDDCVKGWDGLLAVEWMDANTLRREAEFCSYRNLTLLSCSWNIDSCKPADLTSTTENASFLTSVLQSENNPDIIVFGFQELIDLDSKKLQAKTLLFGKKHKDASGGGMSEKVSQRYRMWYDKLVQAVRVAMPPETPYTVIHTSNLVGLFTCVFVKNLEHSNLRDVAITSVKRGIAGMYGNKGAIIARLVIDDSSLCFINVHLAAGQRHKAARNADLASILDEEVRFDAGSERDSLAYVGGGDGSMILDHDICFLSGDLNYRIDLRRENVISSLRSGERNYLLEHDQLLKEMRDNYSFRLRTFSEAPICFDPTYKYDRGSTEYDSSEKKRVPAWCDRILFRSRIEEDIQVLHYKRYEPTVSDHRPISGGFSLKVRKVQPIERDRLLVELEDEWQTQHLPARIAEATSFYASL